MINLMHKTDMRKTLFPTNLTLQCGISLQFKKKKKKKQLTLDISNLKRGARGLLQPKRKVLQDSGRSKYGIWITIGYEGIRKTFALDYC